MFRGRGYIVQPQAKQLENLSKSARATWHRLLSVVRELLEKQAAAIAGNVQWEILNVLKEASSVFCGMLRGFGWRLLGCACASAGQVL